jgi:hypothetical protein
VDARQVERDVWPEGETILYQFDGKWLTWEQMRAARVDRLLPRQPRKEWGRR